MLLFWGRINLHFKVHLYLRHTAGVKVRVREKLYKEMSAHVGLYREGAQGYSLSLQASFRTFSIRSRCAKSPSH